MKAAEDYIVDRPHNVDTAPMPTWGLASDNRRVRLSADEELTSAYKEWMASACTHERKGIIKSVNAGGQTCYNWYCANCGHKMSSNIPHGAAAGNEKDVHVDALISRSNVYSAKRQNALTKIEDSAADRQQGANRQEYDKYLDGEHWANIRMRVMRRANGLCEGCLNESAEHVHHLSYDNVGNEFAFELIAVCAECHSRIHDGGEK